MSSPQSYAPDIGALIAAFQGSSRSGQTEGTRSRSNRTWLKSLQSLAHRHPKIAGGLLAGFATSGWVAFTVTGVKEALQPSREGTGRTATESVWHPSASPTIVTETETKTITVDPTTTATLLSDALARLEDAGVSEERIVDLLDQLSADADEAQITVTQSPALTTLVTTTRSSTTASPVGATDQA